MSALKAPHILLDTNAILRYLLYDLPAQANAVEVRLLEARAGRLIIELHPLLLAEVLYVLQSHYKTPRAKIVHALETFLDTPGIKLEEEVRFRGALKRYAAQNVSFIDAYLAVLGVESGSEIFSFDKGLDKFSDIRRIEK